MAHRDEDHSTTYMPIIGRPERRRTTWEIGPVQDNKAVSPTVIHGIASATDTPLDQGIGQLIVGAVFLGKCRTKLLELRNIRFY